MSFKNGKKQDEKQGQEPAVEKMAKAFSAFGAHSFYVGATRASHVLKIYTNDKAKAAKAISGSQDKTSTIEAIQNAGKSRVPQKKQHGFYR